MIDVAILGAGELGGSLAHVLAGRDLVRRIQLIDPAGQVAAGKALDIMQSGPVQGFATPVHGSTDISRVGGAHVVVLADAVRPGDSADPLLTLRQIAQLASRAVVLCATADGRTVVEQSVRELRYGRERVIGTAPEALASAMRALVALQLNASVREVSLVVVGIPPAQAVVNWETATVGGARLTDLLSEPVLRKLSAQVPALWPPGPHVLAHAAADAVSSLCGVSRRALSGFVAPDNQLGQRARAVAMPVRLGHGGVVSIDEPSLGASGRVALDTAAQL